MGVDGLQQGIMTNIAKDPIPVFDPFSASRDGDLTKPEFGLI